jgi:hypothetical protein
MLQYHKRNASNGSTSKNKITRNVPGSEGELQIEGFVAAGSQAGHLEKLVTLLETDS